MQKQQILEWRGVSDLVAAEILCDDNEEGTNHGYVTDTPFSVAGVAEIQKSSDSSSEAHYYDNIPAVVVSNNASDTITISASALSLAIRAKLTGQYYDETTGAIVEGERQVKYFAIGYRTKKTNGDEVYVWRYKGSFNEVEEDNITENASTDANGNELVFTGISTTHKFEKTGKPAKAMCVDTALELCDVSEFFDEVTTPDDLTAEYDYTLTVTQAENTTVTVIRNGVVIPTGTGLNAGDVLTVFVTGGTMTINTEAAASGDSVTVAGNVTIVSTAG